MRPTAGIAVFVVVVCALTPPRALVSDPQIASGRSVPGLQISGLNLIDSLLLLAQQNHIPMGIDYLSRDAFERTISLQLRGITVGRALDAILQHYPGFRWYEKAGVIVITSNREPRGRGNLLDTTVTEFSSPPATPEQHSQVLWGRLSFFLNPDLSTIVGDYGPGNPRDAISAIHMRHVTVRDVLNEIVRQRRDAAWVVQVAPQNMYFLPSYGLWTIYEYEDPPRQFSGRLRYSVWGLGLKTPR